ncbi:MAG TPA: sigma-70 family RNA polymerase sigma factor [Pirellulaceae bacterium]|nr:sigma-70 family RNA polymerase sigma factor [Pirellulaceae bacterium]
MSHEISPAIAKIRAGDQVALAEYIEQHRRQLLAYIERQLGTALRRKVEAEDIFQEVSADAVRSLSAMDLADRDPFSWLCQLAERRIIDAHRRFFDAQKRDAGREVPLGGGDSSDSPGLMHLLVASLTTPSQAFSRNVKEVRLNEAVAQLTAEQREVLRLRYAEGWPTKQIAEQLGKSDVSVRVMLTRTVQKLQEILGEENFEP